MFATVTEGLLVWLKEGNTITEYLVLSKTTTIVKSTECQKKMKC